MNDLWLIEGDDTRAGISALGASLVSLEVGGVDYCPEWDHTVGPSRYHGSVIAPWPNRVADGRYVLGDREFQLDINEVERQNALHGFSANKLWKLEKQTPESVECSLTCGGESGYPWVISLRVKYQVRAAGLNVTIVAENLSEQTAPFGCAFHPYFTLPGPRESWVLRVPSRNVVEVDSARLLPIGISEVGHAEVPFRGHGSPDVKGLDHAFGGFESDLRCILTNQSTSTVSVFADSCTPWLQVHAPDQTLEYSQSLVLEPMSCPPDAFNSGQDVVFLEHKEKYETKLRIEARKA